MKNQSFDWFFSEHRHVLVRIAYLMTGDAGAAEDLAQETLGRVSGRWDTIESPLPYAKTILSRLASEWRRGNDHERPASTIPELSTSDNNDVDEMWDALAGVPADQRVVLVLRYYEDQSYEQIAERLLIPVATARTRAHRGIEHLRRGLRK